METLMICLKIDLNDCLTVWVKVCMHGSPDWTQRCSNVVILSVFFRHVVSHVGHRNTNLIFQGSEYEWRPQRSLRLRTTALNNLSKRGFVLNYQKKKKKAPHCSSNIVYRSPEISNWIEKDPRRDQQSWISAVLLKSTQNSFFCKSKDITW